jgi:hypothetical protein
MLYLMLDGRIRKTRETRCQTLDNNSLKVNGLQSEIWYLISEVFLKAVGSFYFFAVYKHEMPFSPLLCAVLFYRSVWFYEMPPDESEGYRILDVICSFYEHFMR